MTIENEALVSGKSISAKSTFEDDIAQLDALLIDDQPAYLILRRYNSDTPFVSVTYVPDLANVRQKMLFASTRTTLMRELGTEKFAESLFATTKEELTADGFRKHDHHNSEPAPLTEEEATMKAVRQAEADASLSMSARKSHVSSGMAFPFSEESLQALSNLKSDGFINLVQLAINTEKETIELANACSSAIRDFTRAIADDAPRFSFYVFKHTYDGVEQSPIVFLYTCPPQSKIKERMLYASCRANVVAIAERDAGLKVDKKLEAATPDDIGEAQLMEEFHPKRETKTGFQRPKRPGRR